MTRAEAIQKTRRARTLPALLTVLAPAAAVGNSLYALFSQDALSSVHWIISALFLVIFVRAVRQLRALDRELRQLESQPDEPPSPPGAL